jgi:triosephosphate isomerase
MAAVITPLIVGNWKMNGTAASLAEIQALGAILAQTPSTRCVVAICPPTTILAAASALGATSGILTGGQDCHGEAFGAHTGDVSAPMLADAGAQYVIVGHSERRADHGETDADVRDKAQAALLARLTPIICVGESEAQRGDGVADATVIAQLRASVPDSAPQGRVVIAYEPIWAIGTGVTPTLADIEAMHTLIRTELLKRFGVAGEVIPVLYGGSLKPANARDILALANVNGGLVGGASLLAKEFAAIISAV